MKLKRKAIGAVVGGSSVTLVYTAGAIFGADVGFALLVIIFATGLGWVMSDLL